MTRAMPWRGARPAAERLRVWESRDAVELEAAMGADRAYGAYALAQLDPPHFGRARFWLGERADGARGVVVHARGTGRSTLLFGDSGVVEAILALHPGPRLAYLATAAPEHLAALRPTHHAADPVTMRRMHTAPADFCPVPDAGVHIDGDVLSLRRLLGTDVAALNALYRAGGGPSHYTTRDIAPALYWGAFDDARLVSVAGTHVVAPERGVGVVGNVLTHPAYRSRGLATRVTAAVTAALFARGVSLAVLSVDPENTPAVRAYERLGYEHGAPVVEARLLRRSALGARAWWRRLRARRRAEAERRATPVAERCADRPSEELVKLRPREPGGAHGGGAA